MVMRADYFNPPFISSVNNYKNGDSEYIKVLCEIKKFVPNIEVICNMNTNSEAHIAVLQLAKKYTERSKIILLPNDSGLELYQNKEQYGDAEIITSNDINKLCEAIATSSVRIAAIIIGDKKAPPHYYKKVRELTSAEGAIMIWAQLHEPLNKIRHDIKIPKYSQPDLVCFKFVENATSIWIGGKKDIMAFFERCEATQNDSLS